ncbi:unnamed protein product [Adineta ricciae]|uniref:Uncharacterized protein n=1 Tax=Adineta ricciae TaxID=249248 RepID=A0A816DMZ4_ADIRI|nr:unnamed protein product [Adineta ricciae]CAF1635047.1 unnamed protein product [Adineta ricciae]
MAPHDDVEIQLALQHAKKKKMHRLLKNQIQRRKSRLKYHSSAYSCSPTVMAQSLTKHISSVNLTPSCGQPVLQDNLSQTSPTNNNTEDEKTSKSSNSPRSVDTYFNLDNIVYSETVYDLNLHPYTMTSCLSFSKQLIQLMRKSNISKSNANRFVKLIQSALPQPNILPKSYSAMLDSLSVENLFVKRVVCIKCKADLRAKSASCLPCSRDNERHLAFIFDSVQETVFTRVYNRLKSVIDTYQTIFTKNEADNKTNDLVFNNNYQFLRGCTNRPLMSLLLHLDGIDLDRSGTLHLWILSCSILELPPSIRTERQNNVVLSLWVSKEYPDINLWLDRCFGQLVNLKAKGIVKLRNQSKVCFLPGVLLM